MKRTKRFLSLLLSVMLLMSLAMPVMASSGSETATHTITINKNAADYEYEAYQIFSGDIEEKNDGTKVLTEVEWGTGIDYENFLKALRGEVTDILEFESIKKAFFEEWNKTYAPLYSVKDDNGNYVTVKADDVAKILSSDNRTSHAQAFAQMAGYYLEITTGEFKQTETDGVISYKNENVPSGYYLICDTGEVPTNTTSTDFMLKLVETIGITPKDGNVTIDKKIVDGQDKVTDADYSIGDIVTFELRGTLPDYFDSYNKYYYEFSDKMSPGLTLEYIDHDNDSSTPEVPDVTVVFDNDGSLRTVDRNLYQVVTGTINDTSEENNGYTTINIKFDDLHKLEREHPDNPETTEIEGYTISADTKIIVIYKAKLNENAVVGGSGNPNKVTIKFTNNPNNYGEGETEEKVVNVYTFALKVLKKDGHNNDSLNGVKFKLYREHGGARQYAMAENSNGFYTITGWTSVESEGTELETITLTPGSTNPEDKGTFKIVGLEASEYWLKETKTLSGYNEIEDIHFYITKELGNDILRSVTSLNIRLEGKESKPGDPATGTVSTTVINNPGNQLPSTGGIGTTIFYLVGGALVAVAVVLLVTKKRMSNR